MIPNKYILEISSDGGGTWTRLKNFVTGMDVPEFTSPLVAKNFIKRYDENLQGYKYRIKGYIDTPGYITTTPYILSNELSLTGVNQNLSFNRFCNTLTTSYIISRNGINFQLSLYKTGETKLRFVINTGNISKIIGLYNNKIYMYQANINTPIIYSYDIAEPLGYGVLVPECSVSSIGEQMVSAYLDAASGDIYLGSINGILRRFTFIADVLTEYTVPVNSVSGGSLGYSQIRMLSGKIMIFAARATGNYNVYDPVANTFTAKTINLGVSKFRYGINSTGIGEHGFTISDFFDNDTKFIMSPLGNNHRDSLNVTNYSNEIVVMSINNTLDITFHKTITAAYQEVGIGCIVNGTYFPGRFRNLNVVPYNGTTYTIRIDMNIGLNVYTVVNVAPYLTGTWAYICSMAYDGNVIYTNLAGDILVFPSGLPGGYVPSTLEILKQNQISS